jgi:hypothetical protein
MSWKILAGSLLALLLGAADACSRGASAPELLVEIPAGFSGNFVLEMGVHSASHLPKDGDVYLVTVPRSGRLMTSTVLEKPKVTFKNGSGGSIWGYSQSMFTTGDGISIGGKIEFFVGTEKEFEAEQQKKNHSGGLLTSESFASGL